MVRRGRIVAVLAPFCVAACATAIGLDHLEIVPDAPDAAVVVLPDAATVIDAPATVDAPITVVADAACNATALDASVPGSAVHLATAPVIDADLSDWPCAFTHLDSHSAGGSYGAPIWPAEYALGWNDSGIYFACRVFDPHPEGDGGPTVPYLNDACELYLGVSPGSAAGTYRPADVHYIVDYLNQAYSYGPATTPLPPGAQAQAKVSTGSYAVEMFVPTSLLGFTPSASMVVSFDAQVDDTQAGAAQAGILWPYLEQVDASLCGTARYQPSCDTRIWGTAVLGGP